MLTKSQLLSAFNKKYSPSLEDILVYYGGISTSTTTVPTATAFPTGQTLSTAGEVSIYNVKLASISFKELTLSFRHPFVEAEITKPMELVLPPTLETCESWDDVKLALIYMAKEAAISRGYSHIVLSGINYPKSPTDFALIVLVFMLLYGHYNLEILYQFFTRIGLTPLLHFKPYHSYIMYGTFVIHLLEIYFFLVPLFKKYRVPTDYAIEWYLFALLDGYPTIKRFKNRVKMFEDDEKYWF